MRRRRFHVSKRIRVPVEVFTRRTLMWMLEVLLNNELLLIIMSVYACTCANHKRMNLKNKI